MTTLNFPKNFLWGATTAAYQIEGAVTEDGRGESIWDRFSHTEGMIANGDTGDVACDHYHRYQEDITLMKRLGLKGYRFSMAWSRIYPEGKGRLNQKGLDFYSKLVDGLLEAGIEPMATLYHWDLPQALQESGGWANRETVQYFNDYAATIFNVLGDRIKLWITHNEPWVASFIGNALGEHAPGFKDYGLAVQVGHHLLLSHGLAVKTFRDLAIKNGKIGITLNLAPAYPASEAPEDKEAASIADGYCNRWFLDPVFRGSYPADLMKIFNQKFGPMRVETGDLGLIAAPIDFLGINYYFRKVVKHSINDQIFGYEELRPAGRYTEMDWEVYPRSLYDLLVRIDRDYNHPHIYITENGAAFKDEIIIDGKVKDDDRLEYLKSHLTEAERAIQAGVKLDGYLVWSLIDNFEWAFGYAKRFGLIRVDYQTQQRIWKKSADWYRETIKNNGW